MGFLSRTKESKIGSEAQQAYDNGQTRFAARLNFPMTHHGLSGEIPDWSKQIEAIERIGWRCEFFSVAQDFKGRPEAYLLFGRD
ncbi:hypothetical protein SAMN04487904_109178 [Actinopolyspora lacussalsi subsp. righensis]|uniref:DUF4177 domain-containing protein n=2 Tax=Actinopolyspora righensis TaxID=995060 RepID=A0A1I7B698_9ACTN|nr:hypothetical protein SAMN04487904_109178 [Actinopolyspora righensis]